MLFPTEISFLLGLLTSITYPRGNFRRQQQKTHFLWKKQRFYLSFPQAAEYFPKTVCSYEFYGREKIIFRDFGEFQ